MLIGAPWGLLGLLAIPVILAIHLFRRRFRPRAVSALFLYAPQARTPTAGRRRTRLMRRASLLAELAAVLAATWYLADPHLDDRRDARHVVAVLDARARLRAVDAAGAPARGWRCPRRGRGCARPTPPARPPTGARAPRWTRRSPSSGATTG